MANSFWSLVYYHQAWSLLKEKQTLWMLSECTNIVKQTPSLHVVFWYIIMEFVLIPSVWILQKIML